MIGCLRTRVRKQPIIALYFESELVLKFYNLEAWPLFISYPLVLSYVLGAQKNRLIQTDIFSTHNICFG